MNIAKFLPFHYVKDKKILLCKGSLAFKWQNSPTQTSKNIIKWQKEASIECINFCTNNATFSKEQKEKNYQEDFSLKMKSIKY